MTICKNCETEFQGNFCPTCAQSAHVHRFTIGHIAHEVVHETTHVDSGALLLLRNVIYRPGYVAKEFIEGKRKRYFNPFTLLILLIALLVVASNKTNIYSDFNQKMKLATKELLIKSAGKDAAARRKAQAESENIERKMNDADATTKKALDNSKLINFIFLPVISLLTWLFFRKSHYNYAENLVFNIFVACGYTAFFLIFIIPIYLIIPSQVILIMYLYILFMIIFSVVAYRQFYQQSKGWTIIKGITIQIIYLAIAALAGPLLTRYL